MDTAVTLRLSYYDRAEQANEKLFQASFHLSEEKMSELKDVLDSSLGSQQKDFGDIDAEKW